MTDKSRKSIYCLVIEFLKGNLNVENILYYKTLSLSIILYIIENNMMTILMIINTFLLPE